MLPFTLFPSFASSAFPNENVNEVLLGNSEDLEILNEDGSIKHTTLDETEKHGSASWSRLYCSETETFLKCCGRSVGYGETSNVAHLSGTLAPSSPKSPFIIYLAKKKVLNRYIPFLKGIRVIQGQ